MGDYRPRNRADRRSLKQRRATLDEVLDAFARVGATRRPGRAPFDPTRAQRPSTRLHGRGRYGQRRDLGPGLADALRGTDAHRVPLADRIAMQGAQA